jgi:hypothetical protein
MPGRRIQIDYDGEILDMDWDKPTPPTQIDVRDWMQRRRSITPNAPPAGPPSAQDELPDEYKSLQLPVQTPQAQKPPDTGFMGAIGEGVMGLGHFAKNIVQGHPFNPDFSSRMRAQQEVAKGVTDPFVQGAKESYGYYNQGDYLKSAGRALATPVEGLLGIPATGIARDIGEGRYGHAAGQGLFAGALAYAGAKGGKKVLGGKPGAVAGEALPDVPAVRPEPTQMPLEYGFEQQGLPFREAPPAPTELYGPEVGPYGVHDPATQPILQPVIGKQRLGFDAQPTMPWDFGPEAGNFPGGKPKVSGTIGPEGEVIPGNEFVADPRPKMGPPVGTFDKGAGRARPVADKVMGEATEGPVERAATSGIPELQDAAKKTTLFQRVRTKAQGLPGAAAVADVAKANIEVIRSSGKTGGMLADLLEKTRLLGEHFGGDWTNRAKEATKGLTPEQIKIYVESRDKGIVPNDPAVQEALKKRAVIDAEVVQMAKDSGAGLRTKSGDVIPFRERINHWPHIYDRKNLAKNRDRFIADLEKEGWNPQDAKNAVDNALRNGERLISAQHERQGNAPGFRMDLDADYMHLNDMGNRIAQARELGPKDIAGPDSPVSRLIKGTAEPERVTDIISKHLGRDVADVNAGAWAEVNKRTRQVVAAAHLSHFAVSNMSQLATTPLRGNLKAYAGALKRVVTDYKKMVGEAEASGALQTINQDLLREVGGESWISKLYLMKKSETLNRTISSATGRATAESLFKQLKKDPTNKRASARLQNLLLEPIDKVLKQDALTKEQLGVSGGRMSQITQGRAQSIDLPRLWTKFPAAEIPLIFKKYAFQQTRIINDAIMENPARNIPLAIALYGAMGEGIGDIKAGVKGAVSGQGAGQAIADRGEGIERIAANLGQAWAVGMLTDMFSSTTKSPGGFAEWAAGPAVGDATKLGYNAYQAVQGKPKGLAKQGAQAIPFVGSGIAAAVGGGGSKTGPSTRLPRRPSLPSLPRP